MRTIATPDSPQAEESDAHGEAEQSPLQEEKKGSAEPISFSDKQIEEIAGVFQNRAGDARRTATVALVVTVFIGVGILYFFVSAASNHFSVIGTVNEDLKSQAFEMLMFSFSGLIIRIGAVLVGIFIIQVMVNFVRYNTRMYFHWSMCAALIKLSRGNHLMMMEVGPSLIRSSIDFGKMPTSPSEKIVDGIFSSVKEFAKKIPNRG